ncbi:PH and SEC7 domain-containing protein-like [Penaeus monodon]|uniref:PH and SEC7 domain-containing protein-like n=1 Tax=Penaeus monodon TaxID=6687 RepID=UPI0018A70FE9|nr:PH and SEC7 domain-containing protein-like [Penaeus monodon]
MADSMKYVKLKRSETCGFGFSILGGAGSELPPIIYDIIEGSPAANSCQLEILWDNSSILFLLSVLNCLRLSASEVTLKLKTADAGIQQRVQQYLATPNNSDVLRTAITRDDLQGVRHIKAKKSSSRTPPEQSSSTPPSLPSPTLSDASDRATISHGSNHTASENGIHVKDRTTAENERNKQKPKNEAYLMTGDLILNLSRTSHDPSWLPQQRTVDDLRKSGSCSVPTSPNETYLGGGRLAKHEVGSPQSLCSPVSADSNPSGVQFTYPPTSTAVRISKSEDHLQYQKDNMCAVNIELDDDVTSSLNTLLDTRDDPSNSPVPSEECDHRIVWTFNAPTSPGSVHSSHDSDSPLIRSPSPTSPQSPTSSMQYSCSGVYDKMCSGRDSLGSSNRSENVCSNSSSLTSPDTDVPDELEWDDTTPTLQIPSAHANGFGAKDLLPNGHNMGGVMTTESRSLVTDKAKVRKQDENRIVIRVEGPDMNSSRRRPTQLSRGDEQIHHDPQDSYDASCDPDLTPTNTRPPTPGSGTLSPDTLAYQELRESEDEITCLSEEDAGKTSIRTSSTTSPPLSEDESDIDSLHSFHYSPKAVDIPSAVRLAKRLISLDGFKKSDVSRHLSKNNEFSRAVAEEYLNYFDFRGDTLDKALRKFLDKFCLTGETQERERVLVHFSRRYLDCNPGTFNSQDAVHTLTCALMLLNTDLHGQSVGRKMTCNEFIDNLADLNDGENFPREVLKSLYQAMRSQPLQWATDDDVDTEGTGTSKTGSSSGDSQGVVVGSNPFLSPPTGNGIVYKKGYIMRKCCTDPNGKKTAFGKRSWKMWFCVVQDLVLYLHKDEQGARRGPQHAQLGHNAIRLHHALATRAHDYSKKEHVFRLQTADQAEYLLQTSDSKELQAWIDTINLVAASLSAPPLPGAVGSQRKFQRPLLPCSITKLNLTEQLEDHTERLAQLERELEDHKAHPPEKTSRAATASNYREKEAYLNSEVKRYRTYVYLLRSRLTSQQSGQQGTNAGIDVGDLPVFEARPAGEGAEGGERGARVVPPPIPERARPGDSPPLTAKFSTESKSPETSLGITSEGSQFAPAQNGDDALTLKSNKLEENKIGELEDSVSNKGTLKKKNKEEREKKKLEKENEKFMKEIERKEKEVEKKEKARERKERDLEKKEKEKEKKDQDKKEKEQQQKEKKQKEKEKKKWDPSQVDNDKEIKEKENKEQEDKQKETPDEDPRIGTLNRLSALFKFSKLNSKSGHSEDDNTNKKGQSVRPATDPEAPPLPPKPSPNSPIMKSLGTRLDI